MTGRKCQEKIEHKDNLKERIQGVITHITLDMLSQVHHEWET